jgi:hypothetical protein
MSIYTVKLFLSNIQQGQNKLKKKGKVLAETKNDSVGHPGFKFSF